MSSYFILILCLIFAGKSSEVDFNCEETYEDITDLYNICKNPFCSRNNKFEEFCQNMYEQLFRCNSSYIPRDFICDGVPQCDDSADEDPYVCKRRLCKSNMYKCDDGKCIDLSKLCDGISDCDDGVDESPIVCRTLIKKDQLMCPSVLQGNQIGTCHISYGLKSGLISCKEPVPPTTIAEIKCKPFYSALNGLPSYQNVTCLNNGKWNQDVLKCERDCGYIAEARFVPLIWKGWDISSNLWPWHACLYRLSGEKWTFFCSATLISKNVLITAAHCLWKMLPNNLKVALGKSFRDYYKSEVGSQIQEVKEIFLHPLYQDSLGNYGSDIALITLSSPVLFSETVIQICMNRSVRNILQNLEGDLRGMVVGMGLTENSNISDTLRAATVQIVNNEKCVANHKAEFRKYITVSSFCAKGNNGSTVCNGDSGSGLAIKNQISGRWTLEGIVSIRPKEPNSVVCDEKYYSIFTKVGMYSDWIYSIISKQQ